MFNQDNSYLRFANTTSKVPIRLDPCCMFVIQAKLFTNEHAKQAVDLSAVERLSAEPESDLNFAASLGKPLDFLATAALTDSNRHVGNLYTKDLDAITTDPMQLAIIKDTDSPGILSQLQVRRLHDDSNRTAAATLPRARTRG